MRREVLQVARVTPSMSRCGDSHDNAPMERFFHTSKSELVHHRTSASHDEARRGLFADAEGFYDQERLHPGRGYRTPDEAELSAQSVA